MFDFTTIFKEIGRIFVRRLGLNIRNQTGIDGQKYSRPEMSTLKSRQRALKGKTLRQTKRTEKRPLTSVPISRLFVTQDTSKRAFDSISDKDSATVYVTGKQHIGNKATFQEIIGYNSRGQSNINSDIKNPPLVFPTTTREVLLMRDEVAQGSRLLKNEVLRQIKEKGLWGIKRTLTIG